MKKIMSKYVQYFCKNQLISKFKKVFGLDKLEEKLILFEQKLKAPNHYFKPQDQSDSELHKTYFNKV